MIVLWLAAGILGGTSEVVEPPVTETRPEVTWPVSFKERQRAALVADLLRQAKERGKQYIEANKPEVRRNIRRSIKRELQAQGLLTDAIMAQIGPMVSDAVDSLPVLDFEALRRQLEQYDLIIWQQAERLAEEHRLAIMADDEEAIFVLLAAA